MAVLFISLASHAVGSGRETWWQSHDWVAAWITAAGALGAIGVAWWIGIQAGRVATSQKELVGIEQLNEAMSQLDRPAMVRIKRQVAIDWITGCVDEMALGKLLDFVDDLSAYSSRKYLPIGILDDRLGFAIICWWYAALPIVSPVRARTMSPSVWLGAQRLVEALHEYNGKHDSPEWASRPSDQQLDSYFREILASS